MGVPVVSLIGQTHVSRVGLSLLTAVGMGSLTATSPDAYISIAKGLAETPARLQSLRRQTRASLVSSPLCDAVRLTRAMEHSLRQVFASWCAGGHDSQR